MGKRRKTDVEIVSIEGSPVFFSGMMPLPPGVNHSYKTVKVGEITRRVATDELNQFKKSAQLQLSQGWRNYAVLNLIHEHNNNSRLVRIGVVLWVYFDFVNIVKSDLDGRLKAALDAVFLRLDMADQLRGDNQVFELHLYKMHDEVEQRIEVELFCAEEPQRKHLTCT